MLKDLRDFIMRGNVLDLAVAVVIGGAFGQIISSLVNDIIMPPIGLLLGKVNFSSLYLNLSRQPYSSLTAAKAAGAATINYGSFINTIVNFLIVAVVMFLMIRLVIGMQPRKKEEPQAPATKQCPYCLSTIPLNATKCAYCTSQL
ncbi:MAG: large conductance mechanosensitive channel protein MscL [Anaerolineales bacterium]|jgi:large conductance mechanosensitive channel